MLDFDSDAGTHGQFRPPTADRQMLLAMERSDVYVLKPAAPQRPWEFYRNMLPDVPQQGQNAPARSSLPAPPLQRPNLVARGYKLGPKGEPSPAQDRESPPKRDSRGANKVARQRVRLARGGAFPPTLMKHPPVSGGKRRLCTLGVPPGRSNLRVRTRAPACP